MIERLDKTIERLIVIANRIHGPRPREMAASDQKNNPAPPQPNSYRRQIDRMQHFLCDIENELQGIESLL